MNLVMSFVAVAFELSVRAAAYAPNATTVSPYGVIMNCMIFVLPSIVKGRDLDSSGWACFGKPLLLPLMVMVFKKLVTCEPINN